MNFIKMIKEQLDKLIELIKVLATGNLVEIHLKKKATSETNKIIKINNSIIVFILIIVAAVIYFRWF